MQPKLFIAMATVILIAAVVFGQTVFRDPKREQAITEQLALQAPAAVETFQRATAAMDKRDYQQSAQLYREVLKQAPDFTPASGAWDSRLLESAKQTTQSHCSRPL